MEETSETTRDPATELTSAIGGQHATVQKLLTTALGVPAEERGAAFNELSRALAIYAAANQLALHVAPAPAEPADMSRAATSTSVEDISAQRLREEQLTGQTVERLESMHPASSSFRIQLSLLEEMVMRHGEGEQEEVPALIAARSPAELAPIVAVLERAERLVRGEGSVPAQGGYAKQLASARRALTEEPTS